MSKRSLTANLGSAAALLILLQAACDDPAGLQRQRAPIFDGPTLARTAQDDLLSRVRQATARFHSLTQAAAAGYAEEHHCVPRMGYHWLNRSLVDGTFEPSRPEVMLYAPGPNGRPELVAVEYIVLDIGQPRPSFAGHPFDLGGVPIPVSHWSLHVWLYEDNPDGIFTPFNPGISCP